ncbi:MAG: hypothetical protein U5K77_00515 [Candidatus Saccharibacteria bacterium]|nr:hypothetical protein [Candidatus Saccharibacteria bacterium]
MKNAVLVHGKPRQDKYENPSIPKPYEANWFPWATKKLEQHRYQVTRPQMPKPYQPDYRDWSLEFGRERRITHETTLVGLSAGGRVFAEVDEWALGCNCR